MLLCLLFTLFTGNLFTRLLVYSSTLNLLFLCYFVFLFTLSISNLLPCPLVYSSTLNLLFLCYFVFYLPCLQATCLLVYSLTCPLTMLLCLLFTLSTSNLSTRLLVDSSTYHVTLSFIYPVYKQLVHLSTRPLFSHFIFLPFNFLFIFALSFEK